MYIAIILVVVSIVIQVKAIIDILKKINNGTTNKNSQNALLAWLIIVLFFSVIGAIVYFQVEKNRNSKCSKTDFL
jgi:hypothetical protein